MSAQGADESMVSRRVRQSGESLITNWAELQRKTRCDYLDYTYSQALRTCRCLTLVIFHTTVLGALTREPEDLAS